MGWPKSSFGLFHKTLLGKPRRTFRPSQCEVQKDENSASQISTKIGITWDCAKIQTLVQCVWGGPKVLHL